MSGVGDKRADAPSVQPPVYDGYQAQDNNAGMNQPLLGHGQPLQGSSAPGYDQYGAPYGAGYPPQNGYAPHYGAAPYGHPQGPPQGPPHGAPAYYHQQSVGYGATPAAHPGPAGAPYYPQQVGAPAGGAYYPQQGSVPGYGAPQPSQPPPAPGAPHVQRQITVNGQSVVLPGGAGRQVVVVGQGAYLQTPAWRTIITNDLCGCFDDLTSCCLAAFLPTCLAGHNQERVGENCLIGCLCYICCAGCQRSRIQVALGAPDSGCCLNCCLHWHCGLCALSQETRALDCWVANGRPSVVPPAVVVSV